jgi:hypothetical protein
MSRSSVNLLTKKEVAQRAGFKCEYCLLSEQVSFFKFHIEHIRSLKHGGSNHLDNLAYCCPDCNAYKGSDVATFLSEDDSLTRFFNPRKDLWYDHFDIHNGVISGKTGIGKATVQIFKFNEIDRLIFRKELIEIGLYPTPTTP